MLAGPGDSLRSSAGGRRRPQATAGRRLGGERPGSGRASEAESSVWCGDVVVPEQRLGSASRAVCRFNLDEWLNGELLVATEVGDVHDVGAGGHPSPHTPVSDLPHSRRACSTPGQQRGSAVRFATGWGCAPAAFVEGEHGAQGSRRESCGGSRRFTPWVWLPGCESGVPHRPPALNWVERGRFDFRARESRLPDPRGGRVRHFLRLGGTPSQQYFMGARGTGQLGGFPGRRADGRSESWVLQTRVATPPSRPKARPRRQPGKRPASRPRPARSAQAEQGGPQAVRSAGVVSHRRLSCVRRDSHPYP